MLSREERILSEILVSRGLVGKDRIEACAKSRRAAAPSKSLVDVLVDSGDLDRVEAARVAEEAKALDEALLPELPAGKRLGEFRLIREIGRGGMGIVYEAHQESLGRRVALKVLPAGAALDERLAIRFLREARAAGRLRHPGIVPVYTSGRAEGVLYFAMELIEGRSLADAIAEQALPPDDAARIAATVARALEFAHAAGLIHRDVKPENILLTETGHARVADFGLVHETSGGSFTMSRHVLGTPAFIAPEQARGEGADPRSDVYGLGAVLYSMLAGCPPFAGDVPSLVLARVLSENPPDLASVRPEIPRRLVAICRRAMAKNLADRYPSAAALAEDLEAYLEGDRPPADVRERGSARRTHRALLFGVGITIGLGALVAIGLFARARLAAPVNRAAPAPAPARLIHRSLDRKASPAVSFDGRWLAYASDASGSQHIHLLDLAGGEPIDLTPTSQEDHTFPAFAADGRALAFASARQPYRIYVMDLASKTLRVLAERPASGLTWSADGREIYFLDRADQFPGMSASIGKLWAIDVSSGRSRMLTGMYASQPNASLGTNRLAFVAQGGGQTDIWTIPTGGGDAIQATDDAALEWSPAWSPAGDAIYFGGDRDGASGLFRIDLDPGSGRPLGKPIRILSAIFAAPFYLASGGADGRALILIGRATKGRLHRLPALEGRGALDPIRVFPERFLAVEAPDPSPDGRLLAYTAITSQEDLAIDEADGSNPRVLTQDAFHDRSPRWSPDGSRIAFQSDRSGTMEIWTIRPDGSGMEQLTRTDGGAALPVWSPDGRRIAYHVAGLGAFVVNAGSRPEDVSPQALPAPPDGNEIFEPCSWSSDGRSLAGSRQGIVVYSFASKAYRRFTDSGTRPVWLDNRRLLFAAEREVRLLDTKSGTARLLYSFAPGGLSSSLGVAAGGRAIYASLTASSEEIWRIEVKD